MSGLIGFQKLLQILFEISFGKQMYIKKELICCWRPGKLLSRPTSPCCWVAEPSPNFPRSFSRPRGPAQEPQPHASSLLCFADRRDPQVSRIFLLPS
jgi:hypothetical protein